MSEQIMLFVASIFKGMTLNKKMRLEHESLRQPETRILKYTGICSFACTVFEQTVSSNTLL